MLHGACSSTLYSLLYFCQEPLQFCSLWEYFAVHSAICCGSICLYWYSCLHVAHLWQYISNVNLFSQIDIESTKIWFCCGNHCWFDHLCRCKHGSIFWGEMGGLWTQRSVHLLCCGTPSCWGISVCSALQVPCCTLCMVRRPHTSLQASLTTAWYEQWLSLSVILVSLLLHWSPQELRDVYYLSQDLKFSTNLLYILLVGCIYSCCCIRPLCIFHFSSII